MKSVWDAISSPTGVVILALLGAYGAIDAVMRLLRGIPRVWKWGTYHWRNRHLSRDFYYQYREAAYRLSPDRKKYLYVRREKVVALQALTEIPISYRWTGDGDVNVAIEPNSFSLVDAARTKGQTRTRKLIRPAERLEKGNVADYTFTAECTVNGKEPESFLGSASSHRVDELRLRVIFPLGRMPLHVWSVVQNPDGKEVSRKSIEEYDPITGEYQTRIRWPEAHLIYIMDWEY